MPNPDWNWNYSIISSLIQPNNRRTETQLCYEHQEWKGTFPKEKYHIHRTNHEHFQSFRFSLFCISSSKLDLHSVQVQTFITSILRIAEATKKTRLILESTRNCIANFLLVLLILFQSSVQKDDIYCLTPFKVLQTKR